jgi:hypothetical protein
VYVCVCVCEDSNEVRYMVSLFRPAFLVFYTFLEAMLRSLALVACIGAASAGTVLWDGRFNDLNSSTDLINWSWSNEVGPYQYYIVCKSPFRFLLSISFM